jgi:hypothetical protein
MAQNSSWLRKPMYGVGALMRGYGFGVPLEDEDSKKSGKSSGGSYASKTRQNAELHAQQIMNQKALADQQVSYGNVKGIEGPVQTTDSGEDIQNTILQRALGMDGNNQPALHTETDAAGVPTRATPNYFMSVDKDNMQAQGMANKWIGADTAKDRASFIKEALAIQKDKTQLLASESNTARAATQAEKAEAALGTVQVRGDIARLALDEAKIDLAETEAAALTDKKLRSAKERTAITKQKSDISKLEELGKKHERNALAATNKAADRLADAQEAELARLVKIEKQRRDAEKVALKAQQKRQEDETKAITQRIKDDAKAQVVMAGIIKKEQAAEEKAQKTLFKERMQAFRDLSPADQKILKLRTLGPGGALRTGFDAKFTDRIDPESATTRRPPFSLKNALMSAVMPGASDAFRSDIAVPDAERDRLEGPVTDEDWTRMLSPAERGVIMDSLWREAVSNANEKKTNAQDEFSRLIVELEQDPSKRMKYIPVSGNQPADIQPLSEGDLLKTLQSGEPLGDESYNVEGLEFKWDKASQKFVRIHQVG